ncbi:cyclin-A1-4-like [Gastrolobium bilobum]|uniref:cyclin-A1-4-like n=1 Tax=Gastrolobium bilobum TaxID=150636 RepID=UPI002AB07A64|nr:cyclin-A1-4-like [Gastrolobium bilobum]
MSTHNRRSSSFSSSTTSSFAKRHASKTTTTSSVKGKVVPPSHMATKRTPLTNLSNQKSVTHVASRNSGPSSTLVPCSNKTAKAKKEPPPCNSNSNSIARSTICGNVKTSAVVLPKSSSCPRRKRSDAAAPATKTVANVIVPVVPSIVDVSPSKSDGMSTSSSCDSIKSPEVEYLDNIDVSAVDSIQRKISSILNISDTTEPAGSNICRRDIIVELKREGKIANIDNNYPDPQLCATYACDIYKHLRASEAKKRPSTDFMERIQKDINVSMRAILIDWLVEVSEEYRLVPDTLYLSVNYIDRYLSGNAMNRQRLQLLGVACMMIASKYEEICAPQVEEFCYITDNTYLKEEVLQMESAVLNYLKFEMTAPTIKCFLRRYIRAAQDVNEVPSLQLECLTNYIAELSLLEYSMLCYAPSLIAASAVFLAKFILIPSKKPWNSTLQHYTLYRPSDLCGCVKDLHSLCCNGPNSNLPAVREKYSQHKYKYVAKKYFPPSIPQEVFQN